MALNTSDIIWQGYGKVTDADNLSPEVWGVLKTTSGGGTPAAALADGGLQGASTAQAITTTSNAKRILLYYDIGSGNELNFNTTYAGQFVWVWGNFLASSLLELVSANGFGIMLGSWTGSQIAWSCWTFYGSNNYAGGWKRMVIDPSKTASLTGTGTTEGGGGVNLAAVRYFGIMAKTVSTARFDNMLVDRIDVGTGYAIKGTTGTADAFIKDLITLEETVSNWWGVLQKLNDSGTSLQLLGKLILGDNTGSLATTLSDINSKLFIAEPRYYNAGLVPALPLTATGISIVGNGTGDTNVTIGKAVGTTTGRNGWSIVGNPTYTVEFNRDDGAVEVAKVYGTSFENLTGTLSLNGIHDFNGNNMSGCSGVSVANGSVVKNLIHVLSGQINLNSSGSLTNSRIINNTASASVLATTLNNITGTSFTSDGSNHAIQLSSIGAGSMDWNNTTSGYDAGSTGSPITPTNTGNEDIYVNVGSGTLTINVATGATVPSIRSAGATVNVIAGSVTVKVTSIKEDGSPIGEAYVHLRASDGTGPFPYQDSVTITRSGTLATVAHNAHNMATNDKVLIRGITDKVEDNGVHQITKIDANSYSYTTTNSGSTSYTGTITCTFVALDGLTNISTGIISTTRVYSSDQPVTGWSRKSTSSPFYKQGSINKPILSSSGLDYSAVMVSDE